MYAKIENGQVTEYPLHEGDLENRFPQYKFPLDVNQEVNGIQVPEGYVRVKNTPYPTINTQTMYTVVTQGTPIYQDGEWKVNWVSTPYTDEEKQALSASFAGFIIEKRDELLSKSDKKVLPDLWENYSDEEKKEWKDYRKALRDITSLENFPLNLQDSDWPLEPSIFEVKVV
jgi:hypothetical protein